MPLGRPQRHELQAHARLHYRTPYERHSNISKRNWTPEHRNKPSRGQVHSSSGANVVPVIQGGGTDDFLTEKLKPAWDTGVIPFHSIVEREDSDLESWCSSKGSCGSNESAGDKFVRWSGDEIHGWIEGISPEGHHVVASVPPPPSSGSIHVNEKSFRDAHAGGNEEDNRDLPPRLSVLSMDLPGFEAVLTQIRPQLLINSSGAHSVPHPTNPLRDVVLESKCLMEHRYKETLSIRDILWVEEILLEAQVRGHTPAAALDWQQLGNTRLLIQRACQSLVYLEMSCARCLPWLNLREIAAKRFALYDHSHPRLLLQPYLKCSLSFPDFDEYYTAPPWILSP